MLRNLEESLGVGVCTEALIQPFLPVRVDTIDIILPFFHAYIYIFIFTFAGRRMQQDVTLPFLLGTLSGCRSYQALPMATSRSRALTARQTQERLVPDLFMHSVVFDCVFACLIINKFLTYVPVQ